jgi:hypothetical protein
LTIGPSPGKEPGKAAYFHRILMVHGFPQILSRLKSTLPGMCIESNRYILSTSPSAISQCGCFYGLTGWSWLTYKGTHLRFRFCSRSAACNFEKNEHLPSNMYLLHASAAGVFLTDFNCRNKSIFQDQVAFFQVSLGMSLWNQYGKK